MSRNRPYTDFPRNEQGLVDNFIGTAYDMVKGVYDHLPELRELHDVLEEIPELAQTSVDAALVEAMPPIREELSGFVAASRSWAEQSQASADAAAQSAIEATKVSRMFPFFYNSNQLTYDVTVISGDPTVTTAGLALWVEGAIEYDFTILSGTLFKLNHISAYPDNAQMRIIVNARFDDLVKNFDELQASFENTFQEFLDKSGFEVPVAYTSGLVLTRPTQTVSYLGRDYRVNLPYLPLTTTTWESDSPKMALVGEGTLRKELSDPTGAGLLGFAFNPLSESIKNVAQYLSRQRRNVWEFAELCPGYVPGGNPQLWDWAPAMNAMNGQAGWVPLGVYPIKSVINWDLANTDILMASASGSVIKPVSGFVGDLAVSLGKRSIAAVVSSIYAQNFRIDCSEVTGVKGIGIWGLRDGSGLRNIYVRNCEKENFIFGQAGGGLGTATGLMNQGLIIENCHGINQAKAWTSECVWLLDGLFESTLTGCKALGSTLIDNSVKGFGVGIATESRAVWINGCSDGNLRHATGTNNIGIHYGAWADSCADFHHTHEGVSGTFTLFHGGLASGRARPNNCHSMSPRLYTSTDPGVGNIAYDFGDAGGCSVDSIMYWDSTKKAVRFRTATSGATQFNNFAVVNTTLDVDLSGNLASVEFQVGTASSALVTGVASATTERKAFSLTPSKGYRQHLPNGGQLGADTFWTSLRAGTSGKIRFQGNDGTSLLELDGVGNVMTPQVRLALGQVYSAPSKLCLGTYRLWVDSFGKTRSKYGEPTSAEDGFPFGQKVAVPSTSASSGAPGAWAASTTYFYIYVGDGSTHAWVRTPAATW